MPSHSRDVASTCPYLAMQENCELFRWFFASHLVERTCSVPSCWGNSVLASYKQQRSFDAVTGNVVSLLDTLSLGHWLW